VRYEEGHLESKYGAPYRDYLLTVPRWIPRPFGKPAPFSCARHLLVPSFKAEAHSLLLIVPFLLKELLS